MKAKSLLYSEMRNNFVWSESKKQWTERKRGFGEVIGRMYTVHPKEGDRFYLRLLLNEIRGATSYEDIRKTENGVVHETFYEACRSRNLLQDDSAWELFLQDMVATKSAS